MTKRLQQNSERRVRLLDAIPPLLFAAAVLLASSPAWSLAIGGIDSETQYTGFETVGPFTDDGVLTFFDSFNGFNAPENGIVDSADGFTPGVQAALLGAETAFEAILDTSGFDPATGDVRDAVFIGTGAGPELTIMSGNTVLLALDLNFIEVTQAARSGGALGGPDGTILLGNPDEVTFGVTSALTVVGGTLNAAVGGIGTGAVMELLMSSLSPTMTKALRNSGYLNDDFSNGPGTTAESATWNLTFVPEPGTALLFGASFIGLISAARRRAR